MFHKIHLFWAGFPKLLFVDSANTKRIVDEEVDAAVHRQAQMAHPNHHPVGDNEWKFEFKFMTFAYKFGE